MKYTLYLIDGSSYIFRAYFAFPHLSSSRGVPTSAVFGFTQMFLKLLREVAPEYAAVAFDTKPPTFRHRLYPDYKANRLEPPEDLIPQFELVHRVVGGFGLQVLMLEGYEADDLIGTMARKAEGAGFDVVIVTGDKDFHQLVSDRVTLWDTMKERRIGVREVRERYGVGPEKVIEVMGLGGDTSDNVPGVSGIGEKTAASLIADYGSVEGVLSHLDDFKGKRRERLEADAELARLSRRLVTIETGAPLELDVEDLRYKGYREDELRPLFEELDFHQLLRELAPRAALDREGYRSVLGEDQLDEVVRRMAGAGAVAVDLETDSLDPMKAKIVGVALGLGEGEACYIPVGHAYQGAPAQLDRALVLDRLRPLLEDPARPLYGQNIKYDTIIFQRHGISLQGIAFDPMIASYLLDPGRSSHSLDALAQEFLGHTTITYSEVAGKGKTQVTFDKVPLEKAVPYACEDADVAHQLSRKLEVEVEEAGLNSLLRDVELPLMDVLVEMEMNGVLVDGDHLRELSKSLELQIDGLEERIHLLAGEEFTINSPKQLAVILFEKLGLPATKRTKTGYSTDQSVLEQLAASHELPAEILNYRSLAKLKETYVVALPRLINPATGRIHTSFNQTRAATGRLSSSEPNLQNIPVRTELGREIRRAFIAEEGRVLLSADYSQIELRLLAHLSGDEVLGEAFAAGEDIHARTAAEIFGASPKEITPEQRRAAKTINFGIIYGLSHFRLANELGITRGEAKSYIDGYFERYAGVRRFIDETVARARRDGLVTTILGRRRYLKDIESSNAQARQAAERIAVNTPVQGSAADLIKLAMIRLHEKLPATAPGARMILQVHDELVFEVPEAELPALSDLVTREMEGVMDLSVPLRVDLHHGPNWSEAH